MSASSLRRAVAAALAAALSSPAGPIVPRAEAAEDPAPACRMVDVALTPTDDLQMVVWLEDGDGAFVTTLYITESTGRRGLGNRPGRMDFNSAWRWPYGRRENVFPVWAHRHGLSWPRVMFQNDDLSGSRESDLSHPFNQSSAESYFCRPLRESEPGWDAQTCASQAYTDKGVLHPTDTSLYPPREDIAYNDEPDHPSVETYAAINPFDAVSAATPPGGVPLEITWPIPTDLPAGAYTMFVEVSLEFDHNDTYNPTTYPEPTGILYGDYGAPYRGQPSVVYQVPFDVGGVLSTGVATTYAGYGDPDGLDGALRPPDGTIDLDVPGSGAQRLLTTIDGGDTFRVRVQARSESDAIAPEAPVPGEVLEATATSAVLSFTEPGDDGLLGTVEGYEVRYRAGAPISEDDFLEASPVASVVAPAGPGVEQLVELDGLLPQTTYSVAIRAYDDCKNYGPLTVMQITTGERTTGTVDACFVATAAYGSLMANDVAMLRNVRDSLLRTNALGEVLVEAYYTFGPVLAGVVGESEELRGLARDLLAPVVDWVGGMSYADPPAPR
jgi:hypothetical protein